MKTNLTSLFILKMSKYYTLNALTRLADLGHQSVGYSSGVVGGVAIADVNEQAQVPLAQLLSRTVDRDDLLTAWLQGGHAGSHCEHPHGEDTLRRNKAQFIRSFLAQTVSQYLKI